MNLLAHLLLAERSDTSFAGQILGDEIKGWLDERFAPPIREGIRLHRAIDRYSDDHTLHRELRRTFEPPLRRYAGILVDIGLDHALARQWPAFHADTLNAFSDAAQRRVIAEWPSQAPFSSARLAWLARVLAGYAHPEGIQRALDSVARRLRRRNEVHLCLPELLARNSIFDDAIAALIHDLDRHVRDVALP
ncbi:ACP phosphodiesterase [Salinisphaera sp.]|uniref:acyl carrier protein phosphodiesterase n=1 Tax=Salinisphaera sp. TaxID=1914330 RepID=UPI000C691F80|nr:ACP phosphodiesterase [Salinisphaera sp.]MAS10469.1 hypothetical protein [Salinisphaera sp.]